MICRAPGGEVVGGGCWMGCSPRASNRLAPPLHERMDLEELFLHIKPVSRSVTHLDDLQLLLHLHVVTKRGQNLVLLSDPGLDTFTLGLESIKLFVQ